MHLSTPLRTARAQAVVTASGTNPKIKFYTGAESIAPAAPGNTLLATIAITGPLGTVTNGVLQFNETLTQDNTAHVAGTPTFALVTDAAGTVLFTTPIPAEMSFLGTIATGLDVSLKASTLTEGGA